MRLLSPYAAILRLPGARAFVLPGLIGRLPMAMVGIGIVLLVQPTTDSYAIAGAVAATYQLISAMTASTIGRITDRHGQAATLPYLLAINGLALVALLITARTQAPTWTMFIAAGVAGSANPPIGALARARWRMLTDSSHQLESTKALESILDEVAYVLGPTLTTVLTVAVHPTAGIIGAITLTTLGGIGLTLQRRTQPLAREQHENAEPGAVRLRGVPPLLISIAFLCLLFGIIEVAVVAFAEHHGNRALAGPVLACFSIGSGLAGILWGARQWTQSTVRRYRIVLIALAVACCPLPFVSVTPTLAACAFLAGLTIAPTLICAYGILDELVPHGQITEGLGLVSSAAAIGVAAGSALCGQLIERFDVGFAFGAAPVAGAVATVFALRIRVAATP